MSTLRGAEAYLHAYAASIFGWKCVICSIEAPDQLGLNGQHTASETSVYTDGIDHSKWVTCAKCNSYFHLACVTVGTQQTENQINSQGSFVCTFMGCQAIHAQPIQFQPIQNFRLQKNGQNKAFGQAEAKEEALPEVLSQGR